MLLLLFKTIVYIRGHRAKALFSYRLLLVSRKQRFDRIETLTESFTSTLKTPILPEIGASLLLSNEISNSAVLPTDGKLIISTMKHRAKSRSAQKHCLPNITTFGKVML